MFCIFSTNIQSLAACAAQTNAFHPTKTRHYVLNRHSIVFDKITHAEARKMLNVTFSNEFKRHRAFLRLSKRMPAHIGETPSETRKDRRTQGVVNKIVQTGPGLPRPRERCIYSRRPRGLYLRFQFAYARLYFLSRSSAKCAPVRAKCKYTSTRLAPAF